jgi:hypothetical protein
LSHVTDVKLTIKDDHLDELAAACDALGLELRRDQKTFAWWGSFQNDSNQYGEMTPDRMGKCEHAIRIKGDTPRNGSSGPWEIGVFRTADGNLGLAYDEYGSAGRRLSAKVGAQADKLRHKYAVEVAEKSALAKLARQGWRATRETVAPGRTRIKLRKR